MTKDDALSVNVILGHMFSKKKAVNVKEHPVFKRICYLNSKTQQMRLHLSNWEWNERTDVVSEIKKDEEELKRLWGEWRAIRINLRTHLEMILDYK